jgi:hypothetical protein
VQISAGNFGSIVGDASKQQLYAKSKTVRNSSRIELNPDEEEKLQSMALLHDEMENHI